MEIALFLFIVFAGMALLMSFISLSCRIFVVFTVMVFVALFNGGYIEIEHQGEDVAVVFHNKDVGGIFKQKEKVVEDALK